MYSSKVITYISAASLVIMGSIGLVANTSFQNLTLDSHLIVWKPPWFAPGPRTAQWKPQQCQPAISLSKSPFCNNSHDVTQNIATSHAKKHALIRARANIFLKATLKRRKTKGFQLNFREEEGSYLILVLTYLCETRAQSVTW